MDSTVSQIICKQGLWIIYANYLLNYHILCRKTDTMESIHHPLQTHTKLHHHRHNGSPDILLERIQGIYKRPTYGFEDTIVWERWHFWRSEINLDYHLIQCIRGFCSSPLPIFKLSLQVPWINSNKVIGKYANELPNLHILWRIQLKI